MENAKPCVSRPRLAVAPMIDVTDRHFRMLIRCISPLPVLYTEMTWDRAILYNSPGEREHQEGQKNLRPRTVEGIIGFSEEEHPIVLQLGGSEPETLARAARIGAIRGYDEINLNCGCPAQTRGRSRTCYGARLMKEPERVAACCAAMVAAVQDAASRGELRSVSVPEVTVKCRLGVDSRDSYEELTEFIRTVSAAGVRHFIVHARKAILNLSTAQNRSIPPLRHEWVFRLIADFPSLRFTINGGVGSQENGNMGIEEATELVGQGVHGVMIGRRANADPYLFARSGALYAGEEARSRREVLERYLKYCAIAEPANWDETTPEGCARALITPLTGLFHNTAIGPRWRHALTALMQQRERLVSGEGVPALVMQELLALGITNDLLDERPSLQLQSRKLPRGTRAERVGTARDGSVDGVCFAPASASQRAGAEQDGDIDSMKAHSATGPGPAKGVVADLVRKRAGRGEEEMEALHERERQLNARRLVIRLAAVVGVATALAVVARAVARTKAHH